MFQPLARGHIGFIGWYFIGLLVYLVFATFRARQRIARMPKLPTRTRHFISTIIVLGLLLVGALLVARVDGIPLFPRAWPTPLQAGVGLALALVLAAGMRPFWRRAVATGDRRLYLFSPTTPRERGLWIGVSLMAGVAEETIYRGVLYVLLLTVTRSPWAAAAPSLRTCRSRTFCMSTGTYIPGARVTHLRMPVLRPGPTAIRGGAPLLPAGVFR